VPTSPDRLRGGPSAVLGHAAAVPAGPTPAGPAALVVLLLGSTLVVMAGAVLSPVLALLRADLALSGTAAGLVLYGLAGGAGLVTTSYPALLASRVVFGLGAAAVFTGTTVALLALYQGEQRDRVMGWRSTATSLGGVAWPLLGGALGTLSWHAPFAVYLIGLPLGVATWLTLPATPARVEPGAVDDVPLEPRPRQDPSRRRQGGVARLLRQRPRILGLYALLTTGTVLLYGLVVFLPLRLAELGVTASWLVGALTAVMSVAMSLAGLGYARALARLGYPRLLRATYLAWTVAFAALAATDTLTVVVLAQALFGLGMGLAIPALTVLLEQATPPRLRGRVMALSGTAIFLGQFVSPVLLGPLTDAASVPAGFAAAAALAATVLLALRATDLARPAHPATPGLSPTGADR
jgi:ACDE family multidrug resistance protein